jgi:folate-binding protein YgfZ
VAGEEAALRDSALVIEREDRRRWRVSGPNAMDVLNGLVTNDVSKLSPGGGCYAAALTAKGKVIADLRILARPGAYVVDTSGAAGTGWAEVLRKYVNPRLARYEELTDRTADLAVAGARAAAVIAAVFDMDAARIESFAQHAQTELPLAGDVRLVARTPETGASAYDLLVPSDERARVFALLTEAGAVPASLTTWEVRRIAAGWPVWGKDMDENTLAQEASLDSFAAISYDKGCYTGQETVARVHFRGHVNRYLRRIRYSADAAVPARAGLFDAAGKAVGDIRSSAVSTVDGGVAIAMVRREVTAPATLEARWNGSTAEVQVHADHERS